MRKRGVSVIGPPDESVNCCVTLSIILLSRTQELRRWCLTGPVSPGDTQDWLLNYKLGKQDSDTNVLCYISIS